MQLKGVQIPVHSWTYAILMWEVTGATNHKSTDYVFIQIYLLYFFLPKITPKDIHLFQPKSIKNKNSSKQSKFNFDLYFSHVNLKFLLSAWTIFS